MEYQQPQEATYDPSLYYQSGGYYAYANQQQPYPYYDPYAQPYNQSYRGEPAPIHPPGVPYQHDQQTHLQNHQDAYYQQPHAPDAQQQQQLISASASGSAAVAVGNVEGTQMVAHRPQMQSAYRAGGRRGGRNSRGRGRGYHGPPAASLGRGRGGRHNNRGAESASLNSILVPTDSPVAMPPSTLNPGNEQALSNGHSVPPRQAPRMAWCELCRVECNTPEILEQHKNGKRHKKNLRLHGELQKLNQVKTVELDVQLLKPEPAALQVQDCKESGGKETKEEIVPSANNNENSKEIQPVADISDNVKATTPSLVEPQGKSKDSSGSKRSSRGGRGGKYMRANDGRRRPIEHPKPKENIPLVCELCNVKCESQVVFNTHLVGKKHLTHLKRFQGHRELYGDAGVQELYPSSLNASSSSSSVPPVQQGVADPQIVLAQLLNYVVSQAQAQAQAQGQGQGHGQVQEQILPGLLAPLVAGLTASLAPGVAPFQAIGTHSVINPEAAQFQAISQPQIQTDIKSNNGNSESVPTKDAIVADAQAPSTTGTGLGNVSASADT